eukprot:1153706-Pelagomonas_calceolata.AAC.2
MDTSQGISARSLYASMAQFLFRPHTACAEGGSSTATKGIIFTSKSSLLTQALKMLQALVLVFT